MPDIFLSYNREDVAVAQAYRDAFAREGLDVWWDATLSSGETYDEVTEAALRGAKAVVVLWSPRSVASRWVRAEATIAERNKTLMPVTIEPCDRPVMFELTQTADLAHWKGDAADKAWLAFLGDVRRRVGRDGPGPVEAVPVPASASAPVRGGAPVVAVLPLSHRAGDEDLELLGEDLIEEITRELAQSRFFDVIAAGNMAAWRGKPVDYRALGRELQARYLIEGKLQRTGEEVRLTVQLVDADKASIVCSPRFVRKAADMAASPEEFPVAVAAQLGEQIVQIEMARAMAKPGPFSGWEHLLRAMASQARAGSHSTSKVITEARSAVAAAPDFGLAHAVLANGLGVHAFAYGEGIDGALSREIRTHIKRAVELDGDNPTVIARLVLAYGLLGDAETGLRLARRAVELYPHAAHTQFALGLAYYGLGRVDDAVTALEEQQHIAPHDLQRSASLVLLGTCYWLQGKPSEAEAVIDRSLALDPDWDLALTWKAVLAAQRGEEYAARAVIKQLREADPTKSIDDLVRPVFRHPILRERSAGAVAILRRLWDVTEGDA
jgi:TolB-like protein/Flp pilus assembly protein TadD